MKQDKSMKILTLIRQVPDAESSFRITDDAVDLSSTQLVMDTMDEYGVEQALRLREAGDQIEVVALAVGPSKNEEVLRNALALGADRAIHVKTNVALDPVALSKVIADVASAEGIELIFCGGRQSDRDSEAVGGAVAERLGWPQLTWTTELCMEANLLMGRHDTEDGSEGFSVTLPAVVTTQQGLNEPRFPTLPNIVKARRKELRSETLEQYGVVPLVRTIKTELLPRSRLRNITRVADDPAAAAESLANALRKELEVRA
jgi:electron transfer flavoprotein beta subunit